jgi:PTS system mannose-specific IIA component
VGPQTQIESVTIDPDDDVEHRRNDIIAAVKHVDSGDEVAILAEMFGGTPSSLSISVMSQPMVEVLADRQTTGSVDFRHLRCEPPRR